MQSLVPATESPGVTAKTYSYKVALAGRVFQAYIHVELSAASLRAQTDGSKRGPGGKIPRNKISICRVGCESLHIGMHVTAGMLAGLCSSTE